ncbi:MAG: hypothetical protein AABY22_14650 [Nanoarchaeota archaeon]
MKIINCPVCDKSITNFLVDNQWECNDDEGQCHYLKETIFNQKTYKNNTIETIYLGQYRIFYIEDMIICLASKRWVFDGQKIYFKSKEEVENFLML